MKEPITICIIDHLNLISLAYPLLLQEYTELTVVIVGGTMEEVKRYIGSTSHVPEVFLIDIKLMGNHSTNIVRWLHKEYPASRLIAISDSLKYEKIKAMLLVGCVAFFGMNIKVSELYDGICKVHNDCFVSKIEDYIDKKSFLNAKKYNGLNVVVFTLTELDIIDFLCNGWTYKSIDTAMGFNTGCTNYHVTEIFEKLDIHNRNDLLKMAMERGIYEETVVN